MKQYQITHSETKDESIIFENNGRLKIIKFNYSFTKYVLENFIDNDKSEIPGLYLLFNNCEIYVGQSNNLYDRKKQHEINEKDKYFSTIWIFSTKDNQQINKTEQNFFEKEIIDLITKKCNLKISNSNKGNKYVISKVHKLSLKDELKDISKALVYFNLINLDNKITFEIDNETSNLIKVIAKDKDKNDILGFYSKNNKSIMIKKDTSFILNFGRKNEQSKKILKKLIKKLKNKKKIKIQNNKIEFMEDVFFKSPSGAGILIKGGSNNGLITWKIKKNDMTLKEWIKKNS